MISSKDILKSVAEEYTAKRGRAIELCESRKLALYSEIPALKDVDVELSLAATKIMSVVTCGGNVEQSIAQLKRENLALQEKRRNILKENGYPADYTELKFDCEKCHDFGYIGVDMCPCMKRAIAEKGLEASGLGRLAEVQSFDSFSFDYYGETRKNIEYNYKCLYDFAEGFSSNEKRSWLLMGPTGLGKTHLSTAVAVKVIERGYDVVYRTMQTLSSDFAENQFRGGSADKIGQYYECDLLVVDDLGSELTNQFTVSVLYNLINQRANNGLPTIFSTNLNQRELRDRYADRITSRLFGMYNVLVFDGVDIRRQKLSVKKGN